MPIDPPDGSPPPKWARTLVNAANARNRARGSEEDFSMSDLEAAWKNCGGCCAVSGMPFDFLIVGDGQAKHPFAPSLDRIDRHKSYRRDNVRLVISIANFAMNAWGRNRFTSWPRLCIRNMETKHRWPCVDPRTATSTTSRQSMRSGSRRTRGLSRFRPGRTYTGRSWTCCEVGHGPHVKSRMPLLNGLA
jgi:hypothetical protein